MAWEVKTPQGEVIDIPRYETVGQCLSYLINEHQFGPNTRLMYLGRMQPQDRAMAEFPPGSLMIVGKRETAGRGSPPRASQPYIPQPTSYPSSYRGDPEPARHKPSTNVQPPPRGYGNYGAGAREPPRPVHNTDSAIPQTRPTRMPSGGSASRFQYGSDGRGSDYLHSVTPPAGSPTANRQPQHSPPPSQRQSQPASQRQSPRMSPRAKEEWTLTVHIPTTQRNLGITLPEDATLAELTTACVSLEPSLEDQLSAGNSVLKFAFFGKILVGPPGKQLREFGVGNKAVLYAASGQYMQTDALKLYIINQDLLSVRKVAQNLESGSGGPISPEQITLSKRQMGENLTKLLIKLDELMEVEGDMRLERRRLVKECNAEIENLGLSTPL